MEIIKEDNLIIEDYINRYLSNTNQQRTIELIIRPDCNQSCEYCYIYQHGKDLYPITKRKSNSEILNNIQLFLNYLLEKNLYIQNWDIFAGDLFYDDFWFDMMDIFFKYYKNLIQLQDNKPVSIMMPNNFSFCHFDEKIIRVKKYIQKAKELSIDIIFSYSSDGKYSNNIREKQQLSDEYYHKVFSLMAEYGWGAHPMISYEGIDSAIANYDWWVEQYNKYIIPNNPDDYLPGFLEVRNDGWTEEDILKYLTLLDHIIWHRFSMCHYNKNEFMKYLFFPDNYLKHHNILHRHDMDLITLLFYPLEDNIMHCGISKELSINCADLSFIPCHRTSYSFFTGGQFIIENNKIIGIQALEGINGFFNQISANTAFNLKCYNCPNRYFCMKGCRGAQFEYSCETFLPIPSVCSLLNSKINFLVLRYHELDIFNELFSQTEIPLSDNFKRELLKLLKVKGYPEYEYKYI